MASIGVNAISAGGVFYTQVGFTLVNIGFTFCPGEANDTFTDVLMITIMTCSVIQACVGLVTVIIFFTVLTIKSRRTCTVECIFFIRAELTILTDLWYTEIYNLEVENSVAQSHSNLQCMKASSCYIMEPQVN